MTSIISCCCVDYRHVDTFVRLCSLPPLHISHLDFFLVFIVCSRFSSLQKLLKQTAQAIVMLKTASTYVPVTHFFVTSHPAARQLPTNDFIISLHFFITRLGKKAASKFHVSCYSSPKFPSTIVFWSEHASVACAVGAEAGVFWPALNITHMGPRCACSHWVVIINSTLRTGHFHSFI